MKRLEDFEVVITEHARRRWKQRRTYSLAIKPLDEVAVSAWKRGRAFRGTGLVEQRKLFIDMVFVYSVDWIEQKAVLLTVIDRQANRINQRKGLRKR